MLIQNGRRCNSVYEVYVDREDDCEDDEDYNENDNDVDDDDDGDATVATTVMTMFKKINVVPLDLCGLYA